MKRWKGNISSFQNVFDYVCLQKAAVSHGSVELSLRGEVGSIKAKQKPVYIEK